MAKFGVILSSVQFKRQICSNTLSYLYYVKKNRVCQPSNMTLLAALFICINETSGINCLTLVNCIVAKQN